MTEGIEHDSIVEHSHFFLGTEHDENERRTRWVIALCAFMMLAEIIGGVLVGSIALIADGLHMSTHAGALLLAALAYRYARRYSRDRRFSFGTGKLGDLAGFTSAIVLALISLLIGYEAITRFIWPVPIRFAEAIPIACLGLAVNVASVWLLSGGGHDHSHHGHGHSHSAAHAHQDEDEQRIELTSGALAVAIHEDGAPPRFRVRVEGDARAVPVSLETIRPDGRRQEFHLIDHGSYFETVEEVPEPHAFDLRVSFDEGGLPRQAALAFREDDGRAHGAAHRDNNMRAAIVHILADAAVSLLVIVGLLLARFFGWLWMDPVVGMAGAVVVAVWSYGLIRDTGAILLDMTPDQAVEQRLRDAVEAEGDQIADLHVWRLGPGHLAAILSVRTSRRNAGKFYKERLSRWESLSHVTIEVDEAI